MLKKATLFKVQEFLLLITIVFLPIYALPAKFQILGAGGRLSYYTVLLGILCFAVEWHKYGMTVNKKIYYFIIIMENDYVDTWINNLSVL
jgi:hypothetical protein